MLYPQLSKLSEDFKSSMSMHGAIETFAPATMALGPPAPARVERGLAVDAVHGDTAVLRATTRIQRPDGDLKTEFRYAIDRATFRQKAGSGRGRGHQSAAWCRIGSIDGLGSVPVCDVRPPHRPHCSSGTRRRP